MRPAGVRWILAFIRGENGFIVECTLSILYHTWSPSVNTFFGFYAAIFDHFGLFADTFGPAFADP